MQMDMINQLSAFSSYIKKQFVSVNLITVSDVPRHKHTFAGKQRIIVMQIPHRSNMLFGDNEQMNGCFWMNILEHDKLFILHNNVCRFFFIGNSTEKAIFHTELSTYSSFFSSNSQGVLPVE